MEFNLQLAKQRKGEWKKPQHWFDSSTVLLLITNIITIVVAVLQSWSLGMLVWTYWIQSVIIGFFNVLRILQLKQFSTAGFFINGKNPPPTQKTQLATAGFFAFHYGFFHAIYLIFMTIFLFAGSATEKAFFNPFVLLLFAIGFFINHGFSYLSNREEDAKQIRNLGSLMFFPYARIVPMHLTIILGFSFLHGTGSLVLFLSLKTVVDLVMHIIEHGKKPPFHASKINTTNNKPIAQSPPQSPASPSARSQ